MELQTGTDDLSLVEDQQGTLRQEVTDMPKLRLADGVALQHQELRSVALGQGILGDALLGQGVVVGFHRDVFHRIHRRNFSANIGIFFWDRPILGKKIPPGEWSAVDI